MGCSHLKSIQAHLKTPGSLELNWIFIENLKFPSLLPIYDPYLVDWERCWRIYSLYILTMWAEQTFFIGLHSLPLFSLQTACYRNSRPIPRPSLRQWACYLHQSHQHWHQLRFLVQQNTALFSTFRPSSVRPSVTGVTYQLFSIFWRFIPWKPYIFWMHII